MQQCKSKYTEYLSAQRVEIKDRVEQAFVHPLARQAKIAAAKGDKDAAKSFFEQAIIADSSNPYLFDRFAWFTMKNLRELDVAEKLAMHAFSLAPTDLEVSFTLGMIFARKGEVGDADKYLNISRTNGKERNLVLLQMAHARYTCAWKNGTLDGECGFAKINDLLSASKIGAPQTRVHNRHNDEIESLRAKVKNVFRRAGR